MYSTLLAFFSCFNCSNRKVKDRSNNMYVSRSSVARYVRRVNRSTTVRIARFIALIEYIEYFSPVKLANFLPAGVFAMSSSVLTCLWSRIQIMTVPIWKTSREKKAICLSSFQTKKPEVVTIVYCASTCCTFENINASLFQMILKNRGSFFAFELLLP